MVGIDAGTKVGYAALDLNGNLVKAGSEKEVGESRIVEKIREIGIPSLLATDLKITFSNI
ncbi:MAG TPA: DUF460 domain-containing protein [Candidatus Bilamarchaeaceae archaeon]|nr:DUF460 domain-containing protein [Candidatus Bilamarchaeaceae archaeon]